MLALVAGPELRRCSSGSNDARERRSCGREAARRHRGRDRARDLPRATSSRCSASDGGFGDPQITAWATLGLVAARRRHRPRRRVPREPRSRSRPTTSRSLRWRGARRATGRMISLPGCARTRREAGQRDDLDDPGAAAGRRAGPPVSCVPLLAAQRPSGGWSWLAGGAADSNDTAAAIQALLGRRAPRADRSRRRLPRRHQNRDGGFELTAGRGSDTQSTAWAIQGLLAAGASPGTPASATSSGCAARTGATATTRAT